MVILSMLRQGSLAIFVSLVISKQFASTVKQVDQRMSNRSMSDGMSKQLLEEAAKDKSDAVVVHTLDRWSRNLVDTLESLQCLNSDHTYFGNTQRQINHSSKI
jgi:DNA invertase Pin-like site-specific DNA recombinase